MKDDDVHNTLASCKEVAVFAWSVIELLFTRILPLVGFLVAHLVLQAGHLVSEVLITPASHSPSASRRRYRRAFWLSQEQQRRPWLTYSAADLPSPRYTAATAAPWSDSSLSNYNASAAPQYASAADAENVQEAQPLAEIGAEQDLPRLLQPSVAPQDATAVSGYQEKELVEPSATQITIASRHLEEQAQPPSSQTAIVSPASFTTDLTVPQTAETAVPEKLPTIAEESDGQQQESAMPASEAASIQVVQFTPTLDQNAIKESPKNTHEATGQPSDPRRDEACGASDFTTPFKKDDSLTAPRNPSIEGHVVGKSNKSEEKPEPVRPEQESMALTHDSTKRQEFTRRKSPSQTKRHPFAKVLPPSLSQIKRTIMQRSRRDSPPLKSANSYSW